MRIHSPLSDATYPLGLARYLRLLCGSYMAFTPLDLALKHRVRRVQKP